MASSRDSAGSAEVEPATSFRAALDNDAPGYLFSAPARRATIAYVGLAIGIGFVAGLFVAGEDEFLVAWALTGAVCLLPATVAARLAARRAVGAHRDFWRLWFLGLVAANLCLVGVVTAVVTDLGAARAAAGLAAMATIPLWGAAARQLLRSRSGRRSIGVDMLDLAITLVVMGATSALVLLEPARASSAPWFTVLALVAACVLPASTVGSALLYLRTPGGCRLNAGLDIVLGLLSTISAWLLVAQGVSDFTLPAAPILAVQVLDMGILLMQPMFSQRLPTEGLDRFPAAGQIRRWSPTPVLVGTGVAVLLVATWKLHERLPWAYAYSMLVFAALLGLATVRHASMVRETRRLYGEIERVSEERRLLLSSLMRAVEQDRHRVAAQLHEEALASLSALGMIMQTSYAALPQNISGPLAGALTDIRADLAARAESLRELMLAVRPPELDDESLATSFVVLIHELYGEHDAPALIIEVDPQLELDWATKTIVYRIGQEAIHNTWRHARASHLDLSLQWTDGAIVLVVDDDGIGFDPTDLLFESGLATMRLFASLGQGTVRIDRRPDGGTRVQAVLGAHEASVVDDPTPPPRLQVIRGAVETSLETRVAPPMASF